jgi:putative ABC transport system ATP-binding protein
MLVTHDANVAARTERIMFMRDGKIVSELKLPKFVGTDIDGRVEEVTVKMREIGI